MPTKTPSAVPSFAALPALADGPAAGRGGRPSEPIDGDVDPELLALPDPPKGSKAVTVGLLLGAAAASLLMTFALRQDVAYALSTGGAPPELHLAEGVPAGVAPNRLAQASGAVGIAGSVRYERPFRRGSFRVLPVVGRDDLYVETAIPERGETGRFVPPDRFAGRLVPLADAGPRFRGLAAPLGARQDAWILVDGETPASARWSIALAVGLLAAAASFFAAAVRLLRPPPAAR